MRQFVTLVTAKSPLHAPHSRECHKQHAHATKEAFAQPSRRQGEHKGCPQVPKTAKRVLVPEKTLAQKGHDAAAAPGDSASGLETRTEVGQGRGSEAKRRRPRDKTAKAERS